MRDIELQPGMSGPGSGPAPGTERRERFLVTGALGCIGAWTVARLVREGVPVVAFDLGRDRRRLEALMTPASSPAVTFVAGDITDLALVERTPRRARDQQRHPPRRAPGAVLPGRSAAAARSSTSSARSTCSRPSSGDPSAWRRSSTWARSGCSRRPTSTPRPAASRRPPTPIRPTTTASTSSPTRARPGSTGTIRGVVEHRPAPAHGLRRGPRPGHDQWADRWPSRPPSWACRTRSRSAAGPRSSTPRTSPGP